MRQNKICSIKHREFQDYFLIKTKHNTKTFKDVLCRIGCVCARRAAQEVFAWPNGRRIFGWYVDSTISRQPLPNNSMGKYLRFVGLGLGLGFATLILLTGNRTIWKRLCKYLVFGFYCFRDRGVSFGYVNCAMTFIACMFAQFSWPLAFWLKVFFPAGKMEWKYSRNRNMQRHSLI